MLTSFAQNSNVYRKTQANSAFQLVLKYAKGGGGGEDKGNGKSVPAF